MIPPSPSTAAGPGSCEEASRPTKAPPARAGLEILRRPVTARRRVARAALFWLVLCVAWPLSRSRVRAEPKTRRESGTRSLEDPRTLPEVPRPQTLPELTHEDAEISLEQHGGVFRGRRDQAATAHPVVQVTRLSAEIPLIDRRFFLFGGYEVASGNPGGRSRPFFLGGEVGLGVRGVWATSTGLTFGGGLGVLLPTAVHGRSTETESLVRGALALRPWEPGQFTDASLGLLPFVDVRDLLGPVFLQARQSFTYAVDMRGERDVSLFAAATLVLGYRLAREAAVSLELHELYEVTGSQPDDQRAFFAASPGVRLMYEWLQPWAGFTTSLGPTPFLGAQSSWSARVGLTVLFARSGKGE